MPIAVLQKKLKAIDESYYELFKSFEELKDKSLSIDFMLHIWELIHQESLRKQE